MVRSSAVSLLLLPAIAAATRQVRIEACGDNALRIRSRTDKKGIDDSLPGALSCTSSDLSLTKPGDVVRNGNIEAAMSDDGLVTVTRVSDGAVILNEVDYSTLSVTGQQTPVTSVAFESSKDEAIYGFGQHHHGDLNNKGHTYDMQTCITYHKDAKGPAGATWGEACVPFVLGTTNSSVNYGLLWNMPNYGVVSFDDAASNFVAYQAPQSDYFVSTFAANSAGSQQVADIMKSYVDAVGHAPMLPEYAAGYWHSKNRYESPEDFLAAAEGFHNRSVPVDVMVIDYYHWPHMGDWRFNETQWPDVDGMVQKLENWGMKVMVSAWPFVSDKSESFNEVVARGLAANGSDGQTPVWWNDNNCDSGCYLMDQSKQETREFFWSKLDKGYFQHNISIFWLDASEPEISTDDAKAASVVAQYSKGTAFEAGMMFPYWHTQAVHDGLVSAGKRDGDIIMLTRSAWAGMQKFGAALWSGDILSTWGSLEVSVTAGLNAQLSGIAWWTTDIGGYAHGDPQDADFRQLIVRWFQYGATCPLFRQHGARDTEIWGYGEESFAAIAKVINWRKEQKDYVMEQMRIVNETGTPVNRPLWWDFPGDAQAWNSPGVYMFGDKFLVSPVTKPNVTSWTTYLPAGARWQYYFDASQTFDGGKTVNVSTPLDEFPLFVRLPPAITV